jgi:phosphate transport system substrate-binding protein
VSIAKHLLMALSILVLVMQPASAETISIGGSTTVQKYMKLAAAAYFSIHPEISFSISGGGSSAGFAQAVGKRVHIGMMSRELTAQEAQELGDINQITVAMDAIAPVVSREIYEFGVRQIRPETLARIYRGQITSWKQLGGPDRHIIVIDKNIYHGTRVVFAGYVLGSGNVLESSASVVLDSDDDVIRLINSSDQAIGYVGTGYVDQSVRALSLELDGKEVKPDHANIRNGAYPISRRLYLLVPDAAPDYVQEFVRFVLSEKGMKIVKDAGYLPFNPNQHSRNQTSQHRTANER